MNDAFALAEKIVAPLVGDSAMLSNKTPATVSTSCVVQQAQQGSSPVSTADTTGDIVEWSSVPSADGGQGRQPASGGVPAHGHEPMEEQQRHRMGSELLPLLLSPDDGEPGAGARQASAQVRAPLGACLCTARLLVPWQHLREPLLLALRTQVVSSCVGFDH
jgi:hypothetical protein